MEDLYPTKEGYIPQSNETSSPAPFITPDNLDFKSHLYDYPHKGIFQPDPNTLICKTNCCCKYIGLFIMLYGSLFIVFCVPIGIMENLIGFTIFGFLLFLLTVIVGIILIFKKVNEVKFTFSNRMVEITSSTMCSRKTKILEKTEITNIIFEYNDIQKGVYQSLHIMYKNGVQNDYFGFKKNLPCFTKYEINYFNKEIKRLLNN